VNGLDLNPGGPSGSIAADDRVPKPSPSGWHAEQSECGDWCVSSTRLRSSAGERIMQEKV